RLAELGVAFPRQRSEIGLIPCPTRLPGRVVRRRGLRVPWADFLTYVAAVHAGPDSRVQGIGNRAAELNREVRHAARRIEYAGSDQRLRRARLEAQRARAASIERRRVGVERQAAQDFTEEQPRSEIGIDDAGILADPADAGVLRVHALLHGARVDVRPRLE